MTRRCSACSGDGHSRRTCNSTKKQFKLFGVRLTPPDIIKKSASSGNISHHCSADDSPEGYHSDHGPFGSTRRQLHRKKGTPWTEEEHRQFLLGLQVLGKGDWRGISQNYIPSRTPSQVASHAQKYFIRQSEGPRRKRRPSLFDMDANTSSMQEQCSIPPPDASIDNQKLMNSSSQESNITNMHLFLDVSLKPVCMPSPFQLWPPTSPSFKDDNAGPSTHQIRGEPGIEHVGIGQLTLDETKLNLHVEPLPLSLRLPGEP